MTYPRDRGGCRRGRHPCRRRASTCSASLAHRVSAAPPRRHHQVHRRSPRPRGVARPSSRRSLFKPRVIVQAPAGWTRGRRRDSVRSVSSHRPGRRTWRRFDPGDERPVRRCQGRRLRESSSRRGRGNGGRTHGCVLEQTPPSRRRRRAPSMSGAEPGRSSTSSSLRPGPGHAVGAQGKPAALLLLATADGPGFGLQRDRTLPAWSSSTWMARSWRSSSVRPMGRHRRRALAQAMPIVEAIQFIP